MPNYQYKVVPAPTKGTKAKGVKTAESRFALSVEDVLNQMGRDGWEYLRAELLPSEERSGLTGSTTNWRNVLVFRRAQPTVVEVVNEALAPKAQATPDTEPPARPDPQLTDQPRPDPPMATGAERMLKDNGVEELSDVAGMTASLKARAQQKAGTADALAHQQDIAAPKPESNK